MKQSAFGHMTKRWLEMSKLYKRFAEPWKDSCDFSDEAAKAMFDYESNGIGDLSLSIFETNMPNGYAVGKHWLNVQVSMWREDLGKTLWFSELEKDYPRWWLESIFKDFIDEDGNFHYSLLPSRHLI